MASRGWSKIKSGKGKGKLINSDGKTAFQVRQEKYYDAKASSGGGGGGGGSKRMSLEERRQQPEFTVGSAKGAAAKEYRQEIKRLDQERQKEYEPIDAKLKARQKKEKISDGKLTSSNAFKQWDKEAGKIEEKYLPLKEEARNRYERKKASLQELEGNLKTKTSAAQIKRATQKVQQEIPGFKLDAKKAAAKSAENGAKASAKASEKAAKKAVEKAAEKEAKKAAKEQQTAQKTTVTEPKSPNTKEPKASRAAKDKVMGEGGLSVGQMKEAIGAYFEADPKNLQKNNMFQMGTRNLQSEWESKNPGKKWSLDNPSALEAIYRDYVGILPKERNSTGPTSVNGIDVTKYFYPWRAFGLDPKTATKQDIKTSYRKLSQKFHPDNPETGNREAFEAVNTMYRSIMVDSIESPSEKKSRSKKSKKQKSADFGPRLLPPAR
ncbi:MAG: DnaJ domain-containing protein [Microcystis sp. M54BS1]|uniref:DnaJ domain-containing protein n=1 Tax=unclassified Microcystis TaxID=2643300 RepID=UPI00257B2BB2|nr:MULTISPECIES: DnaJ domain-containing protein [unclassified Microcystis]MCA2541463.1 DnaJ domain-containing protein [Microcystis sp. M54BS1]MCA2594911.1 DnaJ domain-containing protein [Microcystis sp. M38BS1]MCA2611872.1 DnaJ domain-containing protein [Microcystis sp. M27BS1]MCA2505408.1 DnaJ domain-containing protein [Microcystis sp. M62BS1]MCA2509195.1 DnaJ domain-containing protein [Microcystis sp. M60BS1]